MYLLDSVKLLMEEAEKFERYKRMYILILLYQSIRGDEEGAKGFKSMVENTLENQFHLSEELQIIRKKLQIWMDDRYRRNVIGSMAQAYGEKGKESGIEFYMSGDMLAARVDELGKRTLDVRFPLTFFTTLKVDSPQSVLELTGIKKFKEAWKEAKVSSSLKEAFRKFIADLIDVILDVEWGREKYENLMLRTEITPEKIDLYKRLVNRWMTEEGYLWSVGAFPPVAKVQKWWSGAADRKEVLLNAMACWEVVNQAVDGSLQDKVVALTMAMDLHHSHGVMAEYWGLTRKEHDRLSNLEKEIKTLTRVSGMDLKHLIGIYKSVVSGAKIERIGSLPSLSVPNKLP